MNQPSPVELPNPENRQQLTERIVSILQGLRFGSVEIVVHDGRVVQIDKHEKFRIKLN